MKNRKLIIIKIILTVLTAAAIGFIFFNSSRSAVESTEQSSPLTEWLNSFLPFTVTEVIVRKLAHFTEYGVLGTLLTATVHLYTRRRSKTFWLSLPIGALVAVCDELIQLFPEGRSCEVRDMLIDTSGVLCAALIVIGIISFLEYKSKRKGKT